MRITKYKTKKDDDGLAYLVKENAINYQTQNLTTTGSAVKMLTEVFEMDKETEEYLYLLCFTVKMKLLGIMEISHGTVNSSLISPREVFQKALLCNASCIILAHNHPSGDVAPSGLDIEVAKRISEAGKIMGVYLMDSLIIGENCYFSMKEQEII